MTIEADIVEALRSSRAAHEAVLAELSRVRTANAALKAVTAELEARVARLEADAVNIVEPEAVRPVMDALARLVADGYGIVAAAPERAAPAEAPRRSSARSWA